MLSKSFRFSIDRGGTFTDVYAEVPDEAGFRVVKLLSEDPQHYPDAPREGIRRILEDVTGLAFPPTQFSAEPIEWIRMGTTVATNALLERKGARTLLLVTRGFRDLLRIGTQHRPRIFDLEIRKPEVLASRTLEVAERVRLRQPEEDVAGLTTHTGVTGEDLVVLQRPDLDALRPQLEQALREGFRAVAVVFMHAYTFPAHEQLVGNLAREVGFAQVSLSHEIMSRVKIVARGDTTTVDAYLTPHIRDYLHSFRSGFADGLRHTPLLFMQSDGGLTDAERFQGSNAILSGPAGGVVGYARTTLFEEAGRRRPVIGFDMGGTSTDVSRFGGDYELVHESETAGVRLQAPQMHIVTVAAGGGSRLLFRNGMLAVGPESAGAHPGPVCYRKNGHLAVTDANLLLGRLHPAFFPNIFGEDEAQPLDLAGTRAAFQELSATINAAFAGTDSAARTPEALALGFLDIANEGMVRPIREISVMRGYDVQEHVLACFGGAGGQHACSIARKLGIRTIFIHRFAGILSAYGMGLADVVVERQEPAAVACSAQTLPALRERLSALEAAARDELCARGFRTEQLHTTRYLSLRFAGTDTALMISEPDDGDFAQRFRSTYRREFGFELEHAEVLTDEVRVRVAAQTEHVRRLPLAASCHPPVPEATTQTYFTDGWRDTPIFRTDRLGAGDRIVGPALLIQDTSTIVLEPSCEAQITAFGDVHIEVLAAERVTPSTQVDPVQLSVFSNLFMSIAEQMGRTLQRTAISTNIKERLDFSCALFDQHGNLIANAPHQPVHLGAMSEAVQQQIRLQGDNVREGDVLVTNHPAAGGSHLPDITVITPVWHAGQIVFFVANRGHHADIGGSTPGSMPPFSRTLAEEGVCLLSEKLVVQGVFQEERMRARLAVSRALADNLSDLKAQVAANQQGLRLLDEMTQKYSLPVVQAYMQHIQDNAAQAVRTMLRQLVTTRGLPDVATLHAEDCMDDGSRVVLRLTIHKEDGSAIFDFRETDSQVWGNWNAPPAVTYSAILYALRCLIQSEIPLNQGCLEPITVHLKEGTLLSPHPEAAVVGGNVLTSQRVTDVILQAFGAAACSQGCMNNFTFGNARFGYYETIGGGAGAGPTWHGQSGVHTHMTNTRITDPEILERRYPVLLREFSLRRGSGGDGAFRGGDGLVRELEFLGELQAAILSERRVFAPAGLSGGAAGQTGRNTLIRRDGTTLNLGGKNQVTVQPGDRLRIETPGGGGFGERPA